MLFTHFGVTTGIVSEFIANASKTARVNRELRMPSMFSHSARSCMSDSVATPRRLSLALDRSGPQRWGSATAGAGQVCVACSNLASRGLQLPT